MTVIDAVQRSATKFNNPDYRFGYGIPDFKKAFAVLVAKNFKGTLSNDKCVTTFTWSGKDNKLMRYDIERKAGTDTGYTRIVSIPGLAAAFTLNSYSFRDSLKYSSPLNIRYRLKQILPGDSSLVLIDSAIAITSTCAMRSGVTVSPNPVKNNINLIINAVEAIQKMSIGLYNMPGQKLYNFEGSIPVGLFTHTISFAGLPSGVYIITIRDNRKIIFSSKIVK